MKKTKDIGIGDGYWLVTIKDCVNARGFTITGEWMTGNTYRRNGWRVAHSGAAIRLETSSTSVKTGSIIIDTMGVSLAIEINRKDKPDRFVKGLRNLQQPPASIEVGGKDVTDEVWEKIGKRRETDLSQILKGLLDPH